MSWCSRSAVVLTVGFALACGGGSGDAELEKALLESRLREAEMRAELAEAKAQETESPSNESGKSTSAPSSSAPKAGVASSGASGSVESSDDEDDLEGVMRFHEMNADAKREEPAAEEPAVKTTADLIGDLEDLDAVDDGGGLGSKLRDAVGSEVTVEGDARVVLVSSKGERTQLPAKVSPGKYEIEATFAGRAPVIVGTAAVKVGSSTVISCSPRMGICRPK